MSRIKIEDLPLEQDVEAGDSSEMFGGRGSNSARGRYLTELAAYNNSLSSLNRAKRKNYQALIKYSRLTHAKQTELAQKYGLAPPAAWSQPAPSFGHIRAGQAPGWAWKNGAAVKT